MFSRIRAFFKYIRDNQFDRSLMKYFDWPLFLIVIVISLFGVVCIFSATSSQVKKDGALAETSISNPPSRRALTDSTLIPGSGRSQFLKGSAKTASVKV